MPDKCCTPGQSRPDPGSGCCEPPANEDEDTRQASGKCIPNGVNGCQRAALLKSTCCGPHGNSTSGSIFRNVPSVSLFKWTPTETPLETDDHGFLTDSSDAVLLKELKSIIQEHSTHRPFSSPEPRMELKD